MYYPVLQVFKKNEIIENQLKESVSNLSENRVHTGMFE